MGNEGNDGRPTISVRHDGERPLLSRNCAEQKIQIAANDLHGFYDWDCGFCGGICVGFSECDGVRNYERIN